MEAEESRFQCFLEWLGCNVSVLYLTELGPGHLQKLCSATLHLPETSVAIPNVLFQEETLFRKHCFPVIIFLDR